MADESDDYADYDLPPMRLPSGQSVGLFILFAALALSVPILLYAWYWSAVIAPTR